MKTAIFLYGPSGTGKTILADRIAKEYDFKHCDSDDFRLIFSSDRSDDRSFITNKVCYVYARELIKKKYNIIVEALPPLKIRYLKRLLKKNKYKIIEISLVSSLKKCLTNNKKRTKRRFSEETIRYAYKKYYQEKGYLIDTTNLTEDQVYTKTKKQFLS